MEKTFITKSAEETKAIAVQFAATLRGGEIIALIGDLGAGKTTFTQGLGAALGSSARIKSPTFTVMNEYPIAHHPTIRRVVHIDFYRFAEEREIQALELDDYRAPDTVIIAEWPQKAVAFSEQANILIYLTARNLDERNIVIKRIL